MLQTSALPLGYVAKLKWSGRRDSNSRPSPWQGDALPLSHSRIWCPEAESNHRHEDFQSSALPTELSGHIKNINFQIAHSLVLCTRLRHCLKTTSLFLPLSYTDSHYLGIKYSILFEYFYKKSYKKTIGAPSGARTLDTLIKSQVLYQLS